MIRHVAFLECDTPGCTEIMVGCRCLTARSTRDANTLKKGRHEGWGRVHADHGLEDLCPECLAFTILMDLDVERMAA